MEKAEKAEKANRPLSEAAIERRLCTLMQRRGALAYKFVSPGRDGVPDRLFILPWGQTIYVEVKTKRGKLSPVQKMQIGQMQENFAEVHVVYGLEQAEALVERVFREAGAT